jgi:hypothetical protein
MEEDLLTLIFSYLPAPDLLCAGLSCRSWFLKFEACKIVPDKRFKRVNFIIIGNQTNRRVTFFTAAVNIFMERYNNILPATVIDWDVALDSLDTFNIDWDKYLYKDSDTINMIRFDSPGESFDVEKKLLAQGSDPMYQTERTGMRIRAQDAMNLTFDKGIIRYQRQWYLGFEKTIMELAKRIENVSNSALRRPLSIRFMNDPNEIMVMFDKRRSHAIMKHYGIPMPKAVYDIANYDDLRTTMKQNNLEKVFVKLAHGSSASGVVAYACIADGHKLTSLPFTEVAITSAELVRNNNTGAVMLYNSLKIRKYTRNRDIRDVIDQLCAEKAIIEEWLPKAKHQGVSFDLRIMVINGKMQHFVLRTSTSPMTNLHLGNKRGDSKIFLDDIMSKAPKMWGSD